MEKLKFEFTVDEANMVLNALAQLPFAQVASLINNFKTQADAQVNKQSVAEAVAE